MSYITEALTFLMEGEKHEPTKEDIKRANEIMDSDSRYTMNRAIAKAMSERLGLVIGCYGGRSNIHTSEFREVDVCNKK